MFRPWDKLNWLLQLQLKTQGNIKNLQLFSFSAKWANTIDTFTSDVSQELLKQSKKYIANALKKGVNFQGQQVLNLLLCTFYTFSTVQTGNAILNSKKYKAPLTSSRGLMKHTSKDMSENEKARSLGFFFVSPLNLATKFVSAACAFFDPATS